jgi:thioredoxin reductase
MVIVSWDRSATAGRAADVNRQREERMQYDVVIVGGGPAGLAAALTLGRARKRVLLCDSGPRRNAAAIHVHNFVTRDGIAPQEFRRIAREQLVAYPVVEVRDTPVQSIAGERGMFDVALEDGVVDARRVLLCTGMIDDVPDVVGMRPLWGTAIFQCPYCHGWEVQDRRFAYLALEPATLPFATFLRGWTRDVVALSNNAFSVPPDARSGLAESDVRVDERQIARLIADDNQLSAIEFADGTRLERDALFVHPRQRQVDLVGELGVALDDKGFVQIDATTQETSRPGIYAAGDLTTGAQGALLAAAAGTRAAAMLNHALTFELARSGTLA